MALALYSERWPQSRCRRAASAACMAVFCLLMTIPLAGYMESLMLVEIAEPRNRTLAAGRRPPPRAYTQVQSDEPVPGTHWSVRKRQRTTAREIVDVRQDVIWYSCPQISPALFHLGHDLPLFPNCSLLVPMWTSVNKSHRAGDISGYVFLLVPVSIQMSSNKVLLVPLPVRFRPAHSSLCACHHSAHRMLCQCDAVAWDVLGARFCVPVQCPY